jgi:hypothetical protein
MSGRKFPTGTSLAHLLLASGQPTKALALGETALLVHDRALGPKHVFTANSASVTADALDALGRTEEAKMLREQYGLTGQGKDNDGVRADG